METTLTDAINRLRNGDATAQFDLQKLLEPLLHELVRRVRQKRAPYLRPRIDSYAIVNEALKSFLSGISKEEFNTLEDTVDVEKVLWTIVHNKLRDEVRKQTAAKRDAGQDVSVEFLKGSPSGGTQSHDSLELAEFTETLYDLVRTVNPNAIVILSLVLDGLNNIDIAAETGLGIRNVQLIRQSMRDAIQEEILGRKEDGE